VIGVGINFQAVIAQADNLADCFAIARMSESLDFVVSE
jgi:hypothetical protein